MKIVVLAKEVPDTYGNRELDLETGLAVRSASEPVLDEIGGRAIEVALSHADAHPGTEVVVISMCPQSADATVRRILAMGVHSAIHIVDEALIGADLGLTAEVLASAARRAGFDLVIAGNLSTDGTGGVLPAMVAEHLGVPHLTALSRVDVSDGTVSGTRESDGGKLTLTAELPAVISITDALPGARLPSFKGLMAAKKKPYETVGMDVLGVDPGNFSVARSIMTAVTQRPPRGPGVMIVDAEDAGERLATFLADRGLA